MKNNQTILLALLILITALGFSQNSINYQIQLVSTKN